MPSQQPHEFIRSKIVHFANQSLNFFVNHPRLYVICLCILCLYASLMSAKPLNTWKATALLINYETFGFVKRGLIGSLIPSSWYQWDYLVMLRWVMDGAMILCLLFIVVKSLALNHAPLNRIKILWGFFCIIAPFTFVQIGLDVARTDHVFLTLAIFAAFVYLYRPRAYVIPVAIFALLPFIHEASVLIAIPMFVMGWIIFNYHEKLSLKPIIAALILAFIGFSALIVFGKQESSSIELHQKINAQAIDFAANEAIANILVRSLEDNIAITMKRYPRRLVEIIGLAVFMLPIWMLMIEMHKNLSPHLRYLYLLPLSTLAITPMFFLGADIFRWIAVGILNLWLLYTLFMIRLGTVEAFYVQLEARLKWLYISIFAALWMGPIGVMSYFPDPFLLIIGQVS